MATKADVIALAFQRLGIGVNGEDIPGAYAQLGERLLNSAMAYLEKEAPAYWSNLGDIPDEALLVLADLLTVDLAPSFSMPAPITRGTAVIRILALTRPDDRLEIPEPEYY